MLMSAPLRCPRLVTCLLLVACGWPLLTPSAATSNDLHSLADLTHPYASIFSPLLKALSEHGGSRWNPGPGGKMTPEERYMTYLTEVYRKTSRVQRSLDGRRCDTVRLIKPQDECFAQSNKGEPLKITTTAHTFTGHLLRASDLGGFRCFNFFLRWEQNT